MVEPSVWLMTIIPALGRLRQEDLKFQASLRYIVRPYLKRKHDKNEKIS
jgi:hypothetical protein